MNDDTLDDIWREWSLEGNNLDLMELGGTPDVVGLAQRIIRWSSDQQYKQTSIAQPLSLPQ